MMATNLTKMVGKANVSQFAWGLDKLDVILKAMAAEIEGNTENLGHALNICNNLLATCKTLSERIDLLRGESE